MLPQFDDMVSLQTRARCRYGIRYDRPSRRDMSVRDKTNSDLPRYHIEQFENVS